MRMTLFCLGVIAILAGWISAATILAVALLFVVCFSKIEVRE